MKKHINKATDKHIDSFLLRSETGHIRREGAFLSYDLFAHLDDRKRVIAYLRGFNLDPFKRGTKEPQAIASALETAKWEQVKDIDPATAQVRSMWD